MKERQIYVLNCFLQYHHEIAPCMLKVRLNLRDFFVRIFHFATKLHYVEEYRICNTRYKKKLFWLRFYLLRVKVLIVRGAVWNFLPWRLLIVKKCALFDKKKLTIRCDLCISALYTSLRMHTNVSIKSLFIMIWINRNRKQVQTERQINCYVC